MKRDKYGANDVPVGLTGWAQINCRDELEIDVKARLDGEYAEKIGFMIDVRCFFGTIFSVLRNDGFLEGGTGQRMGEDRSYPHAVAKKDFNYNPMSFEEGIQIEVNQYLKK